MNGITFVRQVAEHRIRKACLRLPGEMREERFGEWSAELAAILSDPAGGGALRRAARAIRYSAGLPTATRRLRRIADAGDQPARSATAVPWRNGAPPPVPRGPAFRVTAGVGIWLIFVVTLVALVREFPPHSFLQILPGLLAAVCFVALCLADVIRATQVRYLPK